MAELKVPARVRAAAERYRLGESVDGVKGTHPVAECLTAIVLALVAFGAAWLVDRLLHLVPVKPLALVVLALALAGVGLVGYGFFRLFSGSGATYRFAGGIVWTRNHRVDVAPWTAIDEMRVSRRDAKVTQASMITFDGRRIRIEGSDLGTLTTFVDAVERVLRDRRRPVQARHRFDDVEPPGLDIGDRAVAIIDLALGAGLVIGVAVPLWQVGLPGPVAAIVGLVLIGVLQTLAGIRVDRRIAAHGVTLLCIAGLVAMTAAARALPDLNPYAVATAVLVVEMAALSLALSLYRRLPARRPTGHRRRLAASQGWQFARTQTVPVGGPHTAGQLIGVPEGSTTTTLVDVVTGSIDGVPVIVGDRVRRRPLTGDPVQTVWIVALPLALPYVSGDASFDPVGRAVRDTAPNPEVAAEILAAGPIPAALPTWWVEDRFLYAVSPANHAPTLRRATMLTRFAAGLPWSELRRFAIPARL